MKAKEKNYLENLVRKYEIYSKFYKSLGSEKINRGTKEEKIVFWKEMLDKNGFSNDCYFFVYSLLTSEVKNVYGYDFLYGMSEELKNDKEFEEKLITLSGNGNLINYISNVDITVENVKYNDSEQYNEKLALQNKLMKRKV